MITGWETKTKTKGGLQMKNIAIVIDNAGSVTITDEKRKYIHSYDRVDVAGDVVKDIVAIVGGDASSWQYSNEYPTLLELALAEDGVDIYADDYDEDVKASEIFHEIVAEPTSKVVFIGHSDTLELLTFNFDAIDMVGSSTIASAIADRLMAEVERDRNGRI